MLLARAEDRGLTKTSWLDGRHTFSFNRYYDPEKMGFRALRVINSDVVGPGGAFGMHPHENMEILTWILEGELVHKDSMGSHGAIRPGDIQRMSAGTGVFHSEANGSKTEPVRLLQIWLFPERDGLEPSYEQKNIPVEERTNRLRAVASPDARDGSVTIHQDAVVYNGVFEAGASAELPVAEGRYVWVQVARGAVEVNGTELKEGDGLGLSNLESLKLSAVQPSEVIVFDLA